MVVVGSAGGVGAATVAVVSNPGPGLPGDVVGVTSLTDTLIGPKSFLDGSLRNPLTNQFSSLCQTSINHLTLLPRSDILFTDRTNKIIGRNNLIKSNSFYHLRVILFFFFLLQHAMAFYVNYGCLCKFMNLSSYTRIYTSCSKKSNN